MRKKALWLIVAIALPLLALLLIFLAQNIEKYNNLEQMWARNEAFRAFYMLKEFWDEKKVDLKNSTIAHLDVVIDSQQSDKTMNIDTDVLVSTLQKEPFALLHLHNDARKYTLFTLIGSAQAPLYGGKTFFVDEVLAKRFSEFLQGSVQFVPLDASLSLPASTLFFEDREQRYWTHKSGSFTDIYIPFTTSLYVKVTFDRGIFAFMKEDLYKSIFYFISILTIILALFYVLLDRLVLSPIRHISQQIQTLKSSPNNLSLRITCKSNDELGTMVLWINAMLGEIETYQKKELGAKEALLEEERNFLQTIIDSWQHALLVIDHEKILKVNDAFKKIFGSSLERLSTQQEALFAPLLHAQNHETIKISLLERPFFFIINTKPLFQNKRLITLTDVSSFNEQLQTLQKKAMLDPLTSLLNRSGILTLLEEKFHSHVQGLLLFDLDHFKRINDTYGHPIGDEVLKAFSNVLTHNARGTDVIGRIGGEEFVMILSCETLEQLQHSAEKFRTKVEALLLQGAKGESFSLTVSIGGVFNKTGATFESLYEKADQNLYEAKRKGRNQSVVS